MREYFGIYWPSDCRERTAFVLRAFCDESSDEQSEKILYVGGFVGRWESWDAIEVQWKILLDEYGIEYYRASEAEHARKQFDKPPFRTDPRSLSYEQNEMLRIVQRRFREIMLEVGSISGFAVGVPIEVFNSVANTTELQDRFGGTPYYLCGHLAMLIALDGIMDIVRSNELTPFIFDRQEEFEHHMLKVHRVLSNEPSDFRAQLGSLSFNDKRRFIPLQVADTLVYEVRKDFEVRMQNPDTPEREALSQLKNRGRIFSIRLVNREFLEWYLAQPKVELSKYEERNAQAKPKKRNAT